MHKLINDLLNNQGLNQALTSLLIGLVTFLGAALNRKLNSLKRSSLRNEYMNIFNSKQLSFNEKYVKTREIISDYKMLNGNHYISELDKKLRTKAINEISEGMKGGES